MNARVCIPIGIAATGVLLFFIGACAPSDPLVPWDTAPMVRELTSELRRHEELASTFDETEVLAWRRCTMGSAFRVGRLDIAILWGRTATATGAVGWALVEGYRTGGSDEPWKLGRIYRELRAPPTRLGPGWDAEGTWHGFQRYDHPPTSHEICDFAEVSFLAAPPNAYRTVSAGIRRNAWRRIARSEPQCAVAE